VRNDALVGFIQDSRVHVDGNLKVSGFVYDSHIFCGGQLAVEGAGVSGNEKGSLLGGEIIAMQSMELVSVGSPTVTTRLFCGVNPEALGLIKTVKDKLAALNKRALWLRKSIGVDLGAPDAKQRLLKMPNKAVLKQLLLELKEVSAQQDTFLQKIPALESCVFAAAPDACVIKIVHQLIPDVTVEIVKGIKTFKEPLAGKTLAFRPNEGIVEIG
jgi:hypothetical protein